MFVPDAWSCYTDPLLQWLRSLGVGCFLAGLFMGAFLYSDDQLLISPKRRAMAIMLQADICVLGGKSKKKLEKKLKFNQSYKNAATKYLEKNVEAAIKDDPGKASKALKQIGARPGDCQPGGTFQLASHLNQNLTTEESIERFVEYFAEVSQEYSPMDVDKLPDKVKQSLSDGTVEKSILKEFDE